MIRLTMSMKMPTYCRQCKTLMWNMRKNYYRCLDCKASVHEKCIDSYTADGCGGRFCTAKLNSLPTSVIDESYTDSIVTSKRGSKVDKQELPHSPANNLYTFENGSHNIEIPWMNRGLKNIKVDGNRYSGNYMYFDRFTSRRMKFIFDSKSNILDLYMDDGKHVCLDESENQSSMNAMKSKELIKNIDFEKVSTKIRSDLININFQKGVKSSFRLTEKLDTNFDFDDIFEIDTNTMLGAGRFGKVYCGYYKETKRVVAIKKIPILNDPKTIAATYEEAMMLFELDYPAVLKCEGIFQRGDSVILVTEKLDFDMLDYILRSENPPGRLHEAEAKYLCFQLSAAIRHLHSKDIAHCDLKPENVLLKIHSDNVIQLKIADFGYARKIKDGAVRHTLVGTLAYLAPEVVNQELRQHQGYNRSLDIWSFGVIAYVSLCGYFPYREDRDLVEQIIANANLFSGDIWKHITPAAKSYLNEKLLVPDAGRRSNSQSLIYHEWFTKDKKLLKSLSILESKIGMRWITEEFQESPPDTSDSESV